MLLRLLYLLTAVLKKSYMVITSFVEGFNENYSEGSVQDEQIKILMGYNVIVATYLEVGQSVHFHLGHTAVRVSYLDYHRELRSGHL